MSVTADHVLSALRAKHEKDVFIEECNLGSKWAGCRRLDAWAMPKSWSPLKTIGYEVKVSRSDFLRDDKYIEYDDYVHELWIACPWGLVSTKEVPKGVGLMWMNKGGKFTRKLKAAPKKKPPAKSVMVMAYVLMSRVTVKFPGESVISESDLEAWLSDSEQARWPVIDLVQSEISRRVGEIQSENLKLKSEATAVNQLAEFMKSIGLDPINSSRWTNRRKASEIAGLIPQSLLRDLNTTSNLLANLSAALEDLSSQTDGGKHG